MARYQISEYGALQMRNLSKILENASIGISDAGDRLINSTMVFQEGIGTYSDSILVLIHQVRDAMSQHNDVIQELISRIEQKALEIDELVALGLSLEQPISNAGSVATSTTSPRDSFNSVCSQVRYIKRLLNTMTNALANNPQYADDWNVIRNRMASELSQEVGLLNNLREVGNNLANPFAFDAEIAAQIADIESTVSTLVDDSSNKLDNMFSGVAGKTFTQLHSSMIDQQGLSVPDFEGTCGDCSCANTMTALGQAATETEVVERARALHCCTDVPITRFMPEYVKEQIRAANGGTSANDRRAILNSFGFTCDNCQDQSLLQIKDQLESGKGAIINVNHRVLNKNAMVSLINPTGTDHALTITGIEADSQGNPIGLWIHDTGVCSNMGNAFYCNANDYEIWRNTPGCIVQYVSR